MSSIARWVVVVTKSRKSSFIIKMVHGGEPLAHRPSLLPLNADLISVERLQQDEGNDGVEAGNVAPDGEDASAHGGGEVTLLDIEKVGGGVGSSKEGGGLEGALSVVKAIDDSLVLLPRVLIHFVF